MNFTVPAAADITLTFDNAEYAAALNNKSSDMFRQMANDVEREVILRTKFNKSLP